MISIAQELEIDTVSNRRQIYRKQFRPSQGYITKITSIKLHMVARRHRRNSSHYNDVIIIYNNVGIAEGPCHANCRGKREQFAVHPEETG